MTAFVVRTAAACMPSSCWGIYRRVAVLEVETDDSGAPVPVSMISERARGVVRVVEVWDRRHVGKTDACAYRVALAEAEALADKLNAAREHDTRKEGTNG